MEGASDPQRDHLLGTSGLGHVARTRHRHQISADHHLLDGVNVRQVRPGLPADLIHRHLVDAEYRGHGTRPLLAGLLHQAAALLDQPGGLADVQDAGHRESRVLSETMTGHEDGLGHRARSQPLLHRFDGGQAYRHDRRLGVDGSSQLSLVPGEHQLGQRPFEGHVDLMEHRAGGRRVVVKLVPHPDGLGSLAGEQEGDFCRIRHLTCT